MTDSKTVEAIAEAIAWAIYNQGMTARQKFYAIHDDPKAYFHKHLPEDKKDLFRHAARAAIDEAEGKL